MQLHVIFIPFKDPLVEALRTKFICSVANEAVLKTLFKLKDDKLKFKVAKVAKETVHGQSPKRKKSKPPASGVGNSCTKFDVKFEIDSGASDTFCCEATWQSCIQVVQKTLYMRHVFINLKLDLFSRSPDLCRKRRGVWELSYGTPVVQD